MKDRLGVGVIGAGTIALRTAFGHLMEEDVHDKLYLAAVCDPVPGRAEAIVEQYGVKKGYQDVDDLLADPNVDLVTMCSPIGLHYEQGMKAIKAGKHVHFNKTMTVTYEEAKNLIEAAKENNVKIVASPGTMIGAAAQMKRKMILEGKIGRLVWAACSSGNIAQYHLDEKERQQQIGSQQIIPAWYFKKPGGGPLYDSTIYGLHAITGIVGPVKKVTAFSAKTRDSFVFNGQVLPNEMDDMTPMLLEFDYEQHGSVFGVVNAAPTDIPTGMGAMTGAFYGLEGFIDGAGRLNGEALPELSQRGRFLPHHFGNHNKMREAHVYEDIMQLVDWILTDGEQPLCSAEHAAHVVEIIDAAYRSAETGETITLESTFKPLTLDEINEKLAQERKDNVK